MTPTLDEIRREGLEALRERLGRAGMLRFLAQFDNGAGDYVQQRKEWVDGTSLDDLRRLALGAADRKEKSRTTKKSLEDRLECMP